MISTDDNPSLPTGGEPGLVSVIIPTFNRAQLVAQAVASATAQTYSRLEILVIDDGSTDDTAAVIAAEFGSDPRVRYFKKSNAGVSGARNRGLKEARGEFIAFLDSDDLWYSWKLQLQINCLAMLPATVGMIWTDMSAIDERGTLIHGRYLREMYSAWGRHPTPQSLFQFQVSVPLPPEVATDSVPAAIAGYGEIYPSMLFGNLVHTSAALLRRSRQRAVGEFDVDLVKSGEDYDFHLRTCREGPVAFIDVCSISYRIGAADQLTGRGYSRYIAQNFIRTVEKAAARDGPTLPISHGSLNSILAHGYAWHGSELMYVGSKAEGRRQLVRSLRLRLLNREAGTALFRSFLPKKIISAGRQVAHVLNAVIAIVWPF